jgi:hypothetical protein
VDNKDYPCAVRGGAVTALVFIDYRSRSKFKIDLSSKKNNGTAFREIVAMNGIHKMDYHCRVYSDGCGSMAHVAAMAKKLGIDHQYVPPHQQSLNEAEKVCDFAWEAARALMEHSCAPASTFSLAVSYVLYVDLRSATTATRDWLTPYQLTHGVKPSIAKLHRYWTRGYVLVPKSKRRALAKKGLHNQRAEPGRFVGFHSPLSSTYAMMLDGDRDRLVHSLNVSFDDSNYNAAHAASLPLVPGPVVGMHLGARAEEAMLPGAEAEFGYDAYDYEEPAPHPAPHASALCGWPQPQVLISPLPPMPAQVLPEYFDSDDDEWKTHAGAPEPRLRVDRSLLLVQEAPSWCLTLTAPEHEPPALNGQEQRVLNCMLTLDKEQAEAFSCCLQVLAESESELSTYDSVCYYLALAATKDMSWAKTLASSDAADAIESLEAEMESLMSTILKEIQPGDPDYSDAVNLSTPGRLLLDRRRTGKLKSRGVKQGFKEDRIQADGPGFNYYAHVAQMASVRMTVFRPNRGTRRLALKDVRTAFLQSDAYPEGVVKYICFKYPTTGKWRYFSQSGPIYGEASAVIRWEQTIAPWFESEGFTRGDNEPCAFLNEDRDLLALLYVDDNLIDAEEDDIKWALDRLDARFDCKEVEWLSPDSPLDYLGMMLSQDALCTYISMQDYVLDSLKLLGFEGLRPVSTPINEQIDPDSPKLGPELARFCLTACGILGWLASTHRPDVSYTHSRIGQHNAKPTESMLSAIKRVFAYLKGTADLGLAAMIHSADAAWEFYCDSDFAGNDEPQNKRRSQNGYIATLGGAPVLWGSKATSVAFAHPLIGEAHADVSSAAAEIYCAANATFEFMHLSYVADEMGIDFPMPFPLQMDNAAAMAFAEGSVHKSKLKHIDCRQEWVKTLRDKKICLPVKVASKDNLADLFTKILPTHDFTRLRDLIMVRVPQHDG